MKQHLLFSGPALLLAAACLPAQAHDAAPVTTDAQAAQTIARDPATGRLRPATADEARELHEQSKAQRALRARSATSQPHMRHHVDGAKSVRVSDEMVSTAIAIRASDGSIQEQCLPSKSAADAAVLRAGGVRRSISVAKE